MKEPPADRRTQGGPAAGIIPGPPKGPFNRVLVALNSGYLGYIRGYLRGLGMDLGSGALGRFLALRPAVHSISLCVLDIRAAHKTIRIREQDRGLAGIKLEDGRHMWYRVCHPSKPVPYGGHDSQLS